MISTYADPVQLLSEINVFLFVIEESQGIPLPNNWKPMPPFGQVLTVQLDPTSPEYQDVLRRFHATAGGIKVLKIERVQNPRLYQSYMVQKQAMEKNNFFGNNEQQLFHGTDGSNITKINTQGLNRSLCGSHGKCYSNSCQKDKELS